MAKAVNRTIEVKNTVAAGAATDVADLTSCEVQVVGTFSQTMVLQGSNDKTNWVNLTSITSAGLTLVSKKWAWLRFNTTVHSSGSATASVAGRNERSKNVAVAVPATMTTGAKYGVYELDSTTRSLQVFADGATVLLEGSMDGTTWSTDQDVSAGGQFDVTAPWVYIRFNTTATSGTPVAFIIGKRVPRFQSSRVLDTTVPVATPATPPVTPQGTTGSTAYSYKIVALNARGHSAASSAGSTSTGNATLTSGNFNRVTWAAVTGATSYDVYRTASSGTPSSTGFIGNVLASGTLQFDDTGIAGDSATAPTTRTSTNLDIFVGDVDTLKIVVQGSMTGNLDIQGSVDSVNYVKIGSSVTSAGTTSLATSTLMRVRLVWSGYTSGTPVAFAVGQLPLESVPS